MFFYTFAAAGFLLVRGYFNDRFIGTAGRVDLFEITVVT